MIVSMRRMVVALMLAWLSTGAWIGEARGDGGTVRFSQRAGAYDIAVFTSPTPFRAGTVDISVLIQDLVKGQPVPQATVSVTAAPRGRAGGTMHIPATTEVATNKLLRAAIFELPDAGVWEVSVDVEGPAGPAEVRFEVQAGERLPRWLVLWPWLSWPLLAVLLYGVHQYLVWRRSRHPFLANQRAG
jgi:hypothetical protein